MTAKDRPQVARCALHHPNAVMLSRFTSARREPLRPISEREPDFDSRFDDDTLVYDAFWDANGRTIRMIGPPLLNLEQPLADQTAITVPPTAPVKLQVRPMDMLTQWSITPPAGTAHLTVSSGLGSYDVAVGESHCDLFAGRRALITLSKNNRLSWIKDWVRYHRDVHGTDAVLIYDNASTDYTAEDVLAAVGSLSGLKTVVVVAWPFKYGPQGRADGSRWESYYLHKAMLEHARHRYLPLARSVIQGDIDELVVSDRSIHEIAERSAVGVITYHGLWIVDPDHTASRLPDDAYRHRRFSVRLRPQPERHALIFKLDRNRCRSKYTVVPRQCPEHAQWDSHSILHWWPGRLRSRRAAYRHFRPINTSWKYDRSSEHHSPDELMPDEPLRRAYARVDWDA